MQPSSKFTLKLSSYPSLPTCTASSNRYFTCAASHTNYENPPYSDKPIIIYFNSAGQRDCDLYCKRDHAELCCQCA